MNIADILDQNAARIPARPAVIAAEDGRVISHAALLAWVNRLAGALRDLGVAGGDRVAVFLPNSPAYLAACFAAARTGAVATPLDILLSGPEIRWILNNSRARVLVAARGQAAERLPAIRADLPHLEKVVTVGGTWEDSLDFDRLGEGYPDAFAAADCAPDDPATIIYTSGNAGQPRGAVLTHRNLLAGGALHAGPVLGIGDGDLCYTAASFCHAFFISGVMGPLTAGAGVLTAERFPAPASLAHIAAYQVTHFTAVPAMYIHMLEAYAPGSRDLSAWRTALCVGAMPAAYIEQIEETFGVTFCACYGAVETSSTVTYGRRPGSVGRAAPGWQVRVTDGRGREVPAGGMGELWLKGPGLFRGYWEMPGDTAAAFHDEWFKTGDLGRIDADGYCYLVDRKSDRIVRGGYSVDPRAVEDALYAHPAVLEVVVAGAPDPVLGEIPVACIVARPGARTTAREIKAFAQERLAPYKVPGRVEFVASLPKGPTGKILKRIVREQFLNRRG